MLIIIFLITIILFVLYKGNIIHNKIIKSLLKYASLSFIIAILLEATLFNFRHFESLFFKNEFKVLPNYTLNGISCENEKCKIIDKENAYIEFTNLHQKIHNIYISFTNKYPMIISYNVEFTDEASELYIKNESRKYVSKVEKSKYIRVNSSGKSEKLRLDLTKSNHKFIIEEIAINKEVPFIMDSFRILAVSLIFFILFVINPKNELFYKVKYDSKKGKITTAIIILFLATISTNLVLCNVKNYVDIPTSQYAQYQNLARALGKGNFYLDLEVSDKLKSLKNPYDTLARDSQLLVGIDYCWDYAYYQGKYYSYFGIVPCLLTYLPYHLLTGLDLSNSVAMSLAIFTFITAGFYLIYQLVEKYFKNTSYIWYVLLSIFFLFASGFAAFSGEATFYNLPIAYGVSFTCFGLGFWLRATKKSKLDTKYLFLGSICMALVAGCRPQLLLANIFALIIFWDSVFKKKELFSKKSIKETILFVAPYILVASFLMYYNYSRFGNILDFGANYNLTTNDMTKRGFRIDRIFLGIYYFLFAPTQIIPTFPFITKQPLHTSYVGRTIFENMYGGFFFINLICVLGLLAPKFKKVMDNKETYKIATTSLILALIIILFDTQIAGILPRYLSDFGFLIALATVIVILSLLKKEKLNIDLKKVLISFLILSILYNTLTIFLSRYTFAEQDTLKLIYYKIYFLVMFWL